MTKATQRHGHPEPMGSGITRPMPVQPLSTRPTPQTEPMEWWDIEQVAALEIGLFPTDSPWTSAMFWSELAAGHHYVVVRAPGGVVHGYAGLASGDDEAEVQTIGVAPERQGHGIGRLLLEDLLAAAGPRRVLLDVRTDNLPAIKLYESCGFTRIGLRRRYYQPSGADAYTMDRPPNEDAARGGQQ
ncbi:ribosomal-protein-alanine N-acetyltransferase [Nakamurella sp. UYEF19]|uniref:ribosomal protein S18-alanine N-acetyltransferase n=1 Tax=Nakamurella sp. UYEF19 TaxID=1756392 RepID=UPI00339666FB